MVIIGMNSHKNLEKKPRDISEYQNITNRNHFKCFGNFLKIKNWFVKNAQKFIQPTSSGRLA